MKAPKAKSLQESVVTAMDGEAEELFPFLAYIFRDLWELGSDPGVIISLMRKHLNGYLRIKMLDLGCGKGAVSVRAAKELNCSCFGIDGVKEFIEEAKNRAREFGVDSLCCFEAGDIRERIKGLAGFDLVLLGSIGPVFGDYSQTLESIRECVKDKGAIIIDGGYIPDDSDYSHPFMQKREALLKQIEDCGMRLIDESVISKDDLKDSNDYIFKNLKKRCDELINKFPDKTGFFSDYIRKQEEANTVLEKKVVCATMVIGNKD